MRAERRKKIAPASGGGRGIAPASGDPKKSRQLAGTLRPDTGCKTQSTTPHAATRYGRPRKYGKASRVAAKLRSSRTARRQSVAAKRRTNRPVARIQRTPYAPQRAKNTASIVQLARAPSGPIPPELPDRVLPTAHRKVP